MVMRIGGARRKTRDKYKKNIRDKGKLSLKRFFKEYKIGEKVVLSAEPAYQKGIYHRRFHGKSGIITGSQGECYYVTLKDGRVEKNVLVHRVHIKRA